MPKADTKRRAGKAARAGKSPSTQAGEYVREEIDDVRKGKHGVRSPQQAIAIGLSKARRAGVKVPAKKGAKAKTTTPSKARRPSPKRSRAALNALKREPTSMVSHSALSNHARAVAARRGPTARHVAALKAAHTRQHQAR